MNRPLRTHNVTHSVSPRSPTTSEKGQCDQDTSGTGSSELLELLAEAGDAEAEATAEASVAPRLRRLFLEVLWD